MSRSRLSGKVFSLAGKREKAVKSVGSSNLRQHFEKRVIGALRVVMFAKRCSCLLLPPSPPYPMKLLTPSKRFTLPPRRWFCPRQLTTHQFSLINTYVRHCSLSLLPPLLACLVTALPSSSSALGLSRSTLSTLTGAVNVLDPSLLEEFRLPFKSPTKVFDRCAVAIPFVV